MQWFDNLGVAWKLMDTHRRSLAETARLILSLRISDDDNRTVAEVIAKVDPEFREAARRMSRSGR